MIFKLHIAYNKHKMIKIGNQIGEKPQVLSQMLEYFAANCTFMHRLKWRSGWDWGWTRIFLTDDNCSNLQQKNGHLFIAWNTF